MARRTKTVALQAPITWGDKHIKEVTIREPSCDEFLRFGEPQVWARSADGGIFTVEREDVIRKYLDFCLLLENGPHAFGLLSLQDGKAIKGALLSFFIETAAPETSSDGGLSSSSI